MHRLLQRLRSPLREPPSIEYRLPPPRLPPPKASGASPPVGGGPRPPRRGYGERPRSTRPTCGAAAAPLPVPKGLPGCPRAPWGCAAASTVWPRKLWASVSVGRTGLRGTTTGGRSPLGADGGASCCSGATLQLDMRDVSRDAPRCSLGAQAASRGPKPGCPASFIRLASAWRAPSMAGSVWPVSSASEATACWSLSPRSRSSKYRSRRPAGGAGVASREGPSSPNSSPASIACIRGRLGLAFPAPTLLGAAGPAVLAGDGVRLLSELRSRRGLELVRAAGSCPSSPGVSV